MAVLFTQTHLQFDSTTIKRFMKITNGFIIVKYYTIM